MNHLRFLLPSRRLVLAVATLVACAIGVGVATGAGGTASMAGGDNPYPGGPCANNRPPEADFDYSPVPPKPGEDVTFTSTSTDPDGDPLETGWDFDGDWDPGSDPYEDPLEGIDQVGDEAHYTYDAPGDYRVRMGVRDPCGAFDIIDRTVRVEAAETGGPGGGGGPTPGGSSNVTQPQDTTGPTIVIASGLNRTRRVSPNGVFTFILGPFSEDVTGTIGFQSVAAVVSEQRRRARRKKVRIATKAISVAKDKRLAVRAKLPRKGRRVLRRRGRLRMRARVVLRDTLGNASTRNFPFTLKPRRTRRR